MSRLSLRNPLLTPDQIAASPSRKRGMSRDLEADLRAYGCHLIEATGIVLRVPQVVMASAQIMFQRFYYLAAFQDFALRGTVLGALFLACKVEESPQSIRDIINVLDIVIKRDRGYPEHVTDGYDAEFYDLKNEMVIAELQILRKLGFNVQVELPYGLLVNYLRSLQLTDHLEIPQLAWNYLNDSLRSPVYVCFQPETIACAAIYLAAYESRLRLPASPPWWIVFDANGDDVVQAAKAIKALYLRSWPRVLPLDAAELDMHLGGNLLGHVDSERAQRWEKEQPSIQIEAEVPSEPQNVGEIGGGSAAHQTQTWSRSDSKSKSRSRSRSRSRSESRNSYRNTRSPSPQRPSSRSKGKSSHHDRSDRTRSRSRSRSRGRSKRDRSTGRSRDKDGRSRDPLLHRDRRSRSSRYRQDSYSRR
ncbi:hypothetical protein GGF40_003486 [Coemansia sp. RSA 1286]|nr:hypothetical protein GGF40_003486 [Coemansia sp. RSA 1286]